MIGPGKYDDLCTIVREGAKARGVVLLVMDGARGQGFSVQATIDILAQLPQMLRTIADQIERDTKGATN